MLLVGGTSEENESCRQLKRLYLAAPLQLGAGLSRDDSSHLIFQVQVISCYAPSGAPWLGSVAHHDWL